MEEAPCLLTPCGLGADGQAVTHRKVTTLLPLASPVPTHTACTAGLLLPRGPTRSLEGSSLEGSIPGTRLRQTRPPGHIPF